MQVLPDQVCSAGVNGKRPSGLSKCTTDSSEDASREHYRLRRAIIPVIVVMALP